MRRILAKILGRIFATIGFVVVFSVISGLVTFWLWGPETPRVPDRAILVLDFGRSVVENLEPDPLALALGDDQLSFRTLITTLDRAAKDPKVKGALADVSDVSLDLAQIEEVRAAIARFRAGGKFTIAYADTFGELGPGNREYWLASAFEEIWLQPLGQVGLTGPSATLPFFKGALDKLGVTADFLQRHEYKESADMLTKTGVTQPVRENYEKMLGDVTANIVNDVAAARKLMPEQVRALMDEAPLMTNRAQEAGLIDIVESRSAALAKAKEKAGAESELIGPTTYFFASSIGPAPKDPTEVALVYVAGEIVRRADDMALDSQVVTAQSLVAALEGVAKSKAKALILRVDSPGGSVTASESIRLAIESVKKSGKYVVVSMGNMAASGGYWISTAADYIIADPSTITGSIGLFGGKFAAGGLAEKLGVGLETLTTGKMSGLLAPERPFNEEERARMNAVFDDVYTAFTKRVADARKMTPEQVDKVARGRAWLGVSAKEVGLVDELGGLYEAYAAVRKHLKLADNAPLMVSIAPEPEPLYMRLWKILRVYIALPNWISAKVAPLMRSSAAYYEAPVLR